MVIAIFKAGKFIDNIFIYCCLIFIYINQSNAVKALTAWPGRFARSSGIPGRHYSCSFNRFNLIAEFRQGLAAFPRNLPVSEKMWKLKPEKV
jgi:hypothetical protein